MKLANWGNGLGFAGLVLSPLFSIPGIILGIMAFRARTEEEKSGWDGSSVNNRFTTNGKDLIQQLKEHICFTVGKGPLLKD